MFLLCVKIYTEFHEKLTHALVANTTSQTDGRMDVLSTCDSFLLRTETVRRSGRITCVLRKNVNAGLLN